MIVEKVHIERLTSPAYNPRDDLKPGDPEYEKLARSIEEFGYVEPIVWNKRTGNVIGGHQRLKILVASGLKSIECSIVDLDESKEKQLNIALNKISGEWDNSMLAELLKELQEDGVDLTITGFDVDEIGNIIDIPLFTPEMAEAQSNLDQKKEVICPECGCEFTP